MPINDIFKCFTEWPVASKYIIEDGYIKTHPDATIEYKNFRDYFEVESTDEPIYVKLANLFKQTNSNSPLKISQDELFNFISEYGFLGLGRRFLIVQEGKTLSDVKLLLEKGHLGKLDDKKVLVSSEPLKFSDFKKTSSDKENQKPEVLLDLTPQRVDSGKRFFPFFFPDTELDKIPFTEDSFWKNYCEPIGDLNNLDLKLTLLDQSVLSKNCNLFPEVENILTQTPDFHLLFYFRDTLSYHITYYTHTFRSVIEPPKWPHPDETKDEPYRGRIGIQQYMTWCPSEIVRPMLEPVWKRVAKRDRYEYQLGFKFASLLDACYWMLMIETTNGKRLSICPWCGKINRLKANAPHNASYCPPDPKLEPSYGCAGNYSKLKYQQRVKWNKFLMGKYNNDIEKLQSSWGMHDLQEKKGKWTESHKTSILHPMDLRNKQKLSIKAKNDYTIWRTKKTLTNPKNNQILKDDLILSKKDVIQIEIKQA